MEKKRTLARWQFEKSQERMKALEGAARMLLELMNDGIIERAETLKRMLTLADRAGECGIDYSHRHLHHTIESMFREAVENAEKGAQLFAPKGIGSIARLFEGYDGSYEDYLYYNE